jgi:hypothetical protein
MKDLNLGQEKVSQTLVKFVKGAFLILSGSVLLVARYLLLSTNVFSLIIDFVAESKQIASFFVVVHNVVK